MLSDFSQCSLKMADVESASRVPPTIVKLNESGNYAIFGVATFTITSILRLLSGIPLAKIEEETRG